MELFLWIGAGAILLIIVVGVVTRRKCVEEPQVALRDPDATERFFDAKAIESSTDGLGVEAIASGAIH